MMERQSGKNDLEAAVQKRQFSGVAEYKMDVADLFPFRRSPTDGQHCRRHIQTGHTACIRRNRAPAGAGSGGDFQNGIRLFRCNFGNRVRQILFFGEVHAFALKAARLLGKGSADFSLIGGSHITAPCLSSAGTTGSYQPAPTPGVQFSCRGRRHTPSGSHLSPPRGGMG